MQVKNNTELSSVTAADEAEEDAAASLRNPPIFEIHVGADMVYYVGEDPTWGGSKAEVVTSAESGVGLEQARCWETAIRKALMPVTPQPSADLDKGLLSFDNTSHITHWSQQARWLLFLVVCCVICSHCYTCHRERFGVDCQ